MREYLPGAARPELSERLARKADESPTLGKILRGEVPMRLLPTGHDFDYQGGELGRWRTYEVTVPGAKPDGSGWETYMSRWERLPLATTGYNRPAGPRVTILTGEGQMPLSDDPEVIEAVVGEMYRQEDLLRAAEEDQAPLPS
ncbi:MAG TPA: hypothetical protein VLG92_01860 [Candidatus Saccharimonadia bacterium]|nr:hypothetical protein [Candidatus Saccharimonadia bacterium]